MAIRQQKYTTKHLVVDALCIALVLACTMFVNLRLPIAANGGLIHLGNVPLFLAAICFGRRTGALCGAFGMAAFDILAGWTPWAPFTFIIVGLMGYVLGLIAERRPRLWAYCVGVILATAIKICGYYIAEGILYGNWVTPLASIPGNLVQIAVAAAIALPLAAPMRRILGRIVHLKEGN